MLAGGIFDHVGGGFFRYAVDGAWRVPHYEKMLDVNAAMVRLMTVLWFLLKIGFDPGSLPLANIHT